MFVSVNVSNIERMPISGTLIDSNQYSNIRLFVRNEISYFMFEIWFIFMENLIL